MQQRVSRDAARLARARRDGQARDHRNVGEDRPARSQARPRASSSGGRAGAAGQHAGPARAGSVHCGRYLCHRQGKSIEGVNVGFFVENWMASISCATWVLDYFCMDSCRDSCGVALGCLGRVLALRAPQHGRGGDPDRGAGLLGRLSACASRIYDICQALELPSVSSRCCCKYARMSSGVTSCRVAAPARCNRASRW